MHFSTRLDVTNDGFRCVFHSKKNFRSEETRFDKRVLETDNNNMEVEVVFDRVGAMYRAGETITGVVYIRNPSSTTHSGVSLNVEGTVALYPSVRGLGAFESYYDQLKPMQIISTTISLSPKGEKLPAGEVELPFSFPLRSTHPKGVMVETYQGVYVSCLYHVSAVVQHFVGKTVSPNLNFMVIVPGQSAPTIEQQKEDTGIDFRLSQDNIRAAKRYNGDRVPKFLVEGHFDKKHNDIDIPLAGWISVRYCDIRITSLELQLIRVESCASAAGLAREATEIQNIQIGDGDVMRMLEIPVYMFFPRWYTSPSLKTSNMRVEFEVNIVITLEDQNQITQNVPIKLYRSLQA